MTPRAWGPLVILEPIGRGAFGTVYRARDSLGREVALKLFTPRPEQDSAKRARVLQEARLLASISHANIVDVYGADRFDGRLGLWMELIRGRTLDAELRTRGMFSAQEAKLIGLDLCRALAAVHDAGLVHRDVKARNVMREGGGRIVLMDFGTGVSAESGLTDVAGTPLYLAPEIFARQVATRASDVYSLGVLLYHLVSGAYPVSGTDRIEIQRGHDEGRRKRLRDIRPDLPAGFVHAVESALAPDPQRRYQTAGEFEHALMSEGVVPPPRPIPKPLPVRPWLAIAALAVVAVSASIVGAGLDAAFPHSVGRDGRHPQNIIDCRIILRGTGRRPGGHLYRQRGALQVLEIEGHSTGRRRSSGARRYARAPDSIVSTGVRLRRQRRRARRVVPALSPSGPGVE